MADHRYCSISTYQEIVKVQEYDFLTVPLILRKIYNLTDGHVEIQHISAQHTPPSPYGADVSG